MQRLRTLLLARSHIVVIDPDRITDAATAPLRDRDLDALEDELAQLGFVMSLDLAMAVRRMPNHAVLEMRAWFGETLTRGERPTVALAPAVQTAGEPATPYLRRMSTWLRTRGEQPCPWCSRLTAVGALDPCGHLVCRACWAGGQFAGCPICHRRVAQNAPFAALRQEGPRVVGHDGRLALLHLAFDLQTVARGRFDALIARPTALAADERDELLTIIDELGPRTASWLPARVAAPENAAIVVARLLQLSPDPRAIVRATEAHLGNATAVLRVAVALLGGNPTLAPPMHLHSLSRGLRRTLLEALDRLPGEHAVEHAERHRELWKRVGEQLHPSEHAARLPNAELIFAVARGDKSVARWAAPIEAALRAGDPLAAIAVLRERPTELLRRAHHLARVARTHRPDAFADVLAAITAATGHGAPDMLLALATRPARPGTAIAAIAGAAFDELLARAHTRRNFPRAVIDRALERHAWVLACVHASARANVVYVRESDGTFTSYRRRDREPLRARLDRLLAGTADSFRVSTLPKADAPTWCALVTGDLALPADSAGYVADAGELATTTFSRVTAAGLVAELTRRA